MGLSLRDLEVTQLAGGTGFILSREHSRICTPKSDATGVASRPKFCSLRAKGTRGPAAGPDLLLTEADTAWLAPSGDRSTGKGLCYGGRGDETVLKQSHTDLLQELFGNKPCGS